MKLTIPPKLLKSAIDRLSSIPGAVATITHTQAVKFEAGMGGLTLSRFTSTAKISITVEEIEIEDDEGAFYVDFNAISKLASRSGNKIKLSSDDKNLSYDIGATKGKILLFPELEESAPGNDSDTEEITIMADTFCDFMKFAKLASGSDAAGRPALCGVCVRVMEDKLCLIGSNGRVAHVQFLEEKMDVDCTIPTAGVACLINALSGQDGICTLSVGERMVSVSCGNVEASVMLMEDKFPNISPLIEKPASSILSKIKIDKLAIIDGLRMSSDIATGDAKLVDCDFSKKSISIKARDALMDTETLVDCEATGKGKISAPSIQIINALENMDADENGAVEIIVYDVNLFIRQGDKIAFAALSKPS